jgi:aquaporin Z
MERVGRASIAEFIGTFALIFFGVGSIVAGGTLLEVALAHGLAIAIAVSLMAHASGGVFNPAIQVALWVTGRMPTARSIVYVIAQLAGAVVAAAAIRWVVPVAFDAANGGTPAVMPGLALGKAVVVEALTTFFLVWAVYASAIDDRGAFHAIAGFAIGLTITIGILATGPLTGGAMNPARWFGPALVSGDWTNAWVWIVGPIAGGVIAGVSYWWLFLVRREPATP